MVADAADTWKDGDTFPKPISQDPRPNALREEKHRRGNRDAFRPSRNPARDDRLVTLVARSSPLVTLPLWEVALQSRRRAFVSVS